MTVKTKFQVISKFDVCGDDIEIVNRGPVVMVVDDEKIIADTLSIILRQAGFCTVTAYDGLSALSLAMIHNPRLIISDVVMPKMTGVELAMAVSEEIPDCKILLFSGQAATVDLLQQAREAGHNFATLTKPVHPTDMLRRVNAYFSKDGFPEMAAAAF